MNKAEARTEMEEGRKMTHRYFQKHEWVTIKGVTCLSEDGCSYCSDEFFKQRTGSEWNKDWSLYTGSFYTIHFYEGSYMFNSKELGMDQNTQDIINTVLRKQVKHRKTDKTLWATVTQDGKEIARYRYKEARLEAIKKKYDEQT